MKNNKILSDYKKKINLLKKYNEFYFDKDNPIANPVIAFSEVGISKTLFCPKISFR